MSPRPVDRPAHDIDSITAIAIEVLHEKGYGRTSMADIAARAGVTKAALYYHAPGGKEELLERALSRGLDPLWEAVDAARAAGGGPLDQLEVVLSRQIEVLIDRLPEVSLFLRARGTSDAEQAAVARRRQFDREVTALVATAQRAGEVRDDLDPSVVTRLLLGMTNSLIEWYREDGRLPAEAIRDTVLALALDGIRPRTP